jgi:lipid-binding SYLF domain-containing protein
MLCIGKMIKAFNGGSSNKGEGLAIITVSKVGVMVTYSVSTGLLVARTTDVSWSLPSATSSFGMGAQV